MRISVAILRRIDGRQQIIDAQLRHNGLGILGGEQPYIETILALQDDLPFVLLDILFATEQKEIAHLPQMGIHTHMLMKALEERETLH
jgi:hypothetical protein